MRVRKLTGFSVVSLILGLCSVLLGLIFWTVYAGFALGVAGIVFAAIGRRKDKSGVAVGGFVVSVIGTALFVGWILFPTLLPQILMQLIIPLIK